MSDEWVLPTALAAARYVPAELPPNDVNSHTRTM